MVKKNAICYILLSKLLGVFVKNHILIITAFLTSTFVTLSLSASPIHAYEDILAGLPLENACVTESEVRSIQPVEFCLQPEAVTENAGSAMEFTQWVCRQSEVMTMVNPRTVVRDVCVETRNVYHGADTMDVICIKHGKKSVRLPDVFKASINGQIQKIKLPNCQ